MKAIKDIPVIINNRNRLVPLRGLIRWLKDSTIPINVIILDNASSYLPLLKYYESIERQYTIIRLTKNIGPFAPWLSGVVDKYASNGDFYAVTDSDIVPMAECPRDALDIFRKLLGEHPEFNKVGPSLNIFDIPDHYKLKWEVINWELQWWNRPINNRLYQAAIDTTLAMYRKGVSVDYYYEKNNPQFDKHNRPDGFINAVRTGYPYMARHHPWYENSRNPSSEERYVRKHSNIATHWTSRG